MINPFQKSYTAEEISLFRFLSTIKHFERLNYAELQNFLPYLYLRHYRVNEVVFFRDDPSHAVYIVKNGTISLSFDIKDEFQSLTTVKSGGLFGDNALLENTKRIYSSVVTSENADLYVIPQVNLLQIFDENPKIRAKVMTSLSELYNDYTVNLFKSYRQSFGFFDLRMVYNGHQEDE